MKKSNLKNLCISLLAATLIFTGCGASANSSSASAGIDNYKGEYYNDAAEEMVPEYEMGVSGYDEPQAPAEAAGGSTAGNPSSAESAYSQKLIYTYYYNFQTKDFDASLQSLRDRVEEYGGYIERSSINGTQYRYSNYTIRIPSAKVADFLSDTSAIGEIINQESSAEDITLQYYDVKSRLESLHAQHDRLIKLLDRAENLSDIAELENQLSNVEYEISSYQTRMNVMNNQVDYATLNIDINEVYEIAPREKDGIMTRIKKGLSRNTYALGEELTDFFVWFVTSLPYLLLYGIIILIAVLIIRKVRKHANRKSDSGTKGKGILFAKKKEEKAEEDKQA